MYIPEKLKLNKFVEVSIPRTSSYVKRLGLHDVKPADFSGEDSDSAMYLSKSDALAESDKLYEQYQKEANGNYQQ